MTENDKACQNCPKALECVSTDCSKRFVTEQMEEEKLIVQFAEELYGIWQEAKSGELDNWDDQTFEELPEKHKQEYYLTAKRLISLARAGYRSPGEVVDWVNKHREGITAYGVYIPEIEWEAYLKENGLK